MHAMLRPPAAPRSAFRHYTDITTRWSDNDIYGHVNNVVTTAGSIPQ
jgi:acyl-CoA thioester hydrolase